MQKDLAPKRLSLAEIVTADDNWSKYSDLHDSFLEELSYQQQKPFNTDIWLLNYI